MPLRQRSAGWAETSSPIILMGRGHSGTRVLAWICEHLGIRLGTQAGKDTADPGDLRFTRTIKKIAVRNLGQVDPKTVRDRDLRRFTRALVRYHAGLRPDGLWGWKFPETYLIAPLVHRAVPQARYLHLVRDGRDLAFKRHLTDDPKKTLGAKILNQVDAMDAAHPVQAARSWAFQVDTYASFRRRVPDLPVLDLTFEHLVENPVAATESVCDFLRVPFAAEARDWIQTHILPAKIGQFRGEDPATIRAVECAIGPTLRAFGYPPEYT